MSRVPSFSGFNTALPFQDSGGLAKQFQGLQGSPQEAMGQLGTNYANAYNSARSLNESLYNNINQGYQSVLANQTNAADAISRGYTDLASQARQTQAGIQGGYGQLSADVLRGIQGIGQTRATDIQQQYLAQSAAAQQHLISAGLGNSTVLSGVNRGYMSDAQRSLIANDESVANLRAGYQSQIGQAGLGYRERALGQNVAQGDLGLAYQQQSAAERAGTQMSQLGFMNTVQAPYPQAGLYAQLAQQYGATGQANADRGLLMQQLLGQQRTAQDARRQFAQAGQVPNAGGGGGMAYGGASLPGPQGGTLGQATLGGAGFAFPQAPSVAYPSPGEPGGYGGGYDGYGAAPPPFADETDFGGYGGGYAGVGAQAFGGAGGGDYLSGVSAMMADLGMPWG